MRATLRGEEVALRTPDSCAAALDVLVAADKNPRRGIAAALGLCWPVFNRKQRRKLKITEDHPWAPLEATLVKHDFNALAYGGAVLDELMARDLSLEEVSAAGAIALDAVAELLPDFDEVDEVEGNFEAPEPSTS